MRKEWLTSSNDDNMVEKGCSFAGNGGLPTHSTQQREHPCSLFYSVSLALSWAC